VAEVVEYSAENSLPYVLASGGRERVVTPKFGNLHVRVSPAFPALISEFQEKSRRFNAGQPCNVTNTVECSLQAADRSGSKQAKACTPAGELATLVGSPMPVLYDDVSVLVKRAMNTSKVQRLAGLGKGKALVLYLNAATFFDEYAAAHELVHSILYCEGLTKLDVVEGRQRDRELCLLLGRISSATSHFAVNQRMRARGYDVAAREDRRVAAFYRNIRLAGLKRCEGYAVACADLWFHCSPKSRESLAGKAQENAAFVSFFREVKGLFEAENLPERPEFGQIEAVRRHLLERLGLTMMTRFVNPVRGNEPGEEDGTLGNY